MDSQEEDIDSPQEQDMDSLMGSDDNDKTCNAHSLMNY